MLELSNKITLATKISLESGACFYVPVIVHWQGQHPALCCVASFLDSFGKCHEKRASWNQATHILHGQIGRVTRDNMIARFLDVNYLFLFHEGSEREHTIKAVLKLVWRESASCNRILTIGPKFKEIMSRVCEAGSGN